MVSPQPALGPSGPSRCVHREAHNLGDLLRRRATATPDATAAFLRGKQPEDGGSQWRARSWGQLYTDARRVARGLEELGLQRGETLAILGPTGWQWATFDLGAQLLGLVSVGIYPYQSPEPLRYLLDHSGARLIFVANGEELDTVLQAVAGSTTDELGDGDQEELRSAPVEEAKHSPAPGEFEILPALEFIVPWTNVSASRQGAQHPRVRSILRFRQQELGDDEVDRHIRSVSGDDIAMLIYTSGTTGPPKGAMISHGNVLNLCESLTTTFPLHRDDCFFSFLPMAHATERNLSFYGRIAAGVPAGYCTHLSQLLSELPEVGPTIFGSVPRVFEKVYGRLQAKRAESGALRRWLLDLALAVGWRRARYRIASQPVPWRWRSAYRIAHSLVLRRIHDAFGGRVRILLVGAATTPPKVLRFFWSAGFDMIEAYGLTENTVLSHINSPRVRLGTVGQAAPGVECRLAEDGEVLLRGACIFQGYHRDPEATEATLQNGWLHTGDIGTIDDEGFLTLTDRKKHILITAGGKNISPATVAASLEPESPLIGHAYIHGEGRPYLTAVLIPSVGELLEWGARRDLLDADLAQRLLVAVASDPGLRDEKLAAEVNPWVARLSVEAACRQHLLEAVRRGNHKLARVERIRRFAVLDRGMSSAQGELTVTLKPRREVLERHLASIVEQLYEDPGFGLEAEPPG